MGRAPGRRPPAATHDPNPRHGARISLPAALSKAEVVEKWLTRTISNFDVSDLAQKEIAKLRAYKQGTMTTEIYFQELHSLITSTKAQASVARWTAARQLQEGAWRRPHKRLGHIRVRRSDQ